MRVAAPGDSILSTVNPDKNNGNSYASFSGTSAATPLVSGLAALLWATRYGSSASSVADRLTSTADHIAGTGTTWQYGRINAAAALTIPPAPALTTLSQATVVAGGGDFTLTLTGTDFADSAVVQWNGDVTPHSDAHASQLTATIPAGDIEQIGTASITVMNPDGQYPVSLVEGLRGCATRVASHQRPVP